MPMYEYQCRKCKHRFERIQKFSDPILKTCPECGGTVDQLLTAAAVRFKGSGWYATDYARKSSSKAAEGGGQKAEGAGQKAGSEKAGSESSPAGSETKPETKPKSEPGHKKSHDKKK